jgi:hypothetical protein
MAVTVKKKPISPALVSPLVGAPPLLEAEADLLADPLAAEIDALGVLTSDYEAAQALVKDYDKRTALVLARVRALGTEFASYDGLAFRASVDGRTTNRREIVNLPKILVYLGPDTFMKLATLKLSDVDKYLDAVQQADVLKTTPTTSYALTITPKTP